MSIVQMLFSANGRIRRRDFWLWTVVVLIAANVIDLISHKVLTGHPVSQYILDRGQMFTSTGTSFGIAVWSMLLVVQWPMICLNAKRWHDRNRTGYIAVALAIVNLAVLVCQGFHLVYVARSTPAYWGLLVVGLVVGIWPFVELGCLDGTKGPNKYGPSPKQIPAPADVF